METAKRNGNRERIIAIIERQQEIIRSMAKAIQMGQSLKGVKGTLVINDDNGEPIFTARQEIDIRI